MAARAIAPGKIAFLFLTLAVAVVYGRFFVGFAPSGPDIVLQYIPYQQLVRDAIRTGEMPFWNSMTFLGRPLLADIQVGVFYPPNWLHWFLPLPLSFTLLLIAHTAWGLWGSYRLGRTWNFSPPAAALMGVLFVFSGFLTSKLLTGIVLFHYAASWFPWMALVLTHLARGVTRRGVALFAVTIALSLLAGSPQITFYSWIVLTVLALVLPVSGERMARARLVGAFALAFVLAAVVTLPQTVQTYQMARVSFDRGAGASFDYVTEGSLRPRLLGLLINPGLFGPGHKEEIYWGTDMGFSEANPYITLWAILVLLPLGIFCVAQPPSAVILNDKNSESISHHSLHRRLFWMGIGLAAAALVLAPGKYSPLFEIFYRIAPGFDRFRVPARLMFIFTIGVSIAGGVAFERWLQWTEAGHANGRARSLIVAAAALGCVLAFAIFFSREAIWTAFESPVRRMADAAARNALQSDLTAHLLSNALRAAVFTAIAAFALVGLATDASRRALFAWAIPAIAVLELATVAWPLQTATPLAQFEERFYPETPLVREMKSASRGGRVLYTNSLLAWNLDQNQPEVIMNALIMQGLADARGYDPVNAKWIGTWFNRLSALPPQTNPRGYMIVEAIARPQWLPLMGVDLVLDYSDLSSVPGLKLAGWIEFPEGPLGIWRNENYRGLAFAAPFAGIAQSRDAAQEAQIAIKPASADAVTPVVFDEAIMANGTKPASALDARFAVNPITEGGNRFVYQTSFPEPAALLFAQSAYDGWRVYVNGEEQPVSIAAGTFLAANVPAGESIVEWRYEPIGFKASVAVAIAGLLTLLLLAWKRKAQPS